MADVTITAVGLGSDATIKKVQFGEAAAIGAAVYYDSAAGNWKNADANASATTAGADGIAILLTEVEQANEYGVIVTDGTIYIDTGLTSGTTYVVSATAGGIAPDADSVSGWYKTVLGVAGSTLGAASYAHDTFVMKPLVSGKAI